MSAQSDRGSGPAQGLRGKDSTQVAAPCRRGPRRGTRPPWPRQRQTRDAAGIRHVVPSTTAAELEEAPDGDASSTRRCADNARRRGFFPRYVVAHLGVTTCPLPAGTRRRHLPASASGESVSPEAALGNGRLPAAPSAGETADPSRCSLLGVVIATRSNARVGDEVGANPRSPGRSRTAGRTPRPARLGRCRTATASPRRRHVREHRAHRAVGQRVALAHETGSRSVRRPTMWMPLVAAPFTPLPRTFTVRPSRTETERGLRQQQRREPVGAAGTDRAAVAQGRHGRGDLGWRRPGWRVMKGSRRAAGG